MPILQRKVKRRLRRLRRRHRRLLLRLKFKTFSHNSATPRAQDEQGETGNGFRPNKQMNSRNRPRPPTSLIGPPTFDIQHRRRRFSRPFTD